MQQRFFIESYFFYSTCFGHHYAHRQELKRRWLLPVVFRAVVFKLLVWCGAEGHVFGLQDASFCKYQRQQPLYNTLELLMMGTVVSVTC